MRGEEWQNMDITRFECEYFGGGISILLGVGHTEYLVSEECNITVTYVFKNTMVIQSQVFETTENTSFL